MNAYKGGFQPRVGLAWDIKGDGKTALRLGFGRYMSRSNVIASLLRMACNPPWTTQVDTGWNAGAVTLADCPTCRTSRQRQLHRARRARGGGGRGSTRSIPTSGRPRAGSGT